MTSLKYTVN